jgi:hypothetical protein
VYGSVKSVEDHGYVINLGVEGANAFIPKKFLTKKKKEGEEGEAEETKLVVGQLLDGLVSEVKKETKTVFINPNQDRVATKIVCVMNFDKTGHCANVLLDQRSQRFDFRDPQARYVGSSLHSSRLGKRSLG